METPPADVGSSEPLQANPISSMTSLSSDEQPGLNRHVRFLPLSLASIALAVMLLNAGLHDPRVGYDAAAHRDYAIALGHFRLPGIADTTEYFSPPLAYLPPAFLFACKLPVGLVLKAWQVLQVGYAAAIFILLRRVCHSLQLGTAGETACVLTVIAPAVWWRSFAIIRPESLLAVLLLSALFSTASLIQGRRRLRKFLVTGLLWGAVCLTRQWGILALLAVLPACLLARPLDRSWFRGVGLAAVLCACIAGPFYAHSFLKFGSVRAFNRPAATGNPLSWSFHPVKASSLPFTRELLGRPTDIAYADAFGDYWLYFIGRGMLPGHHYLVGTPLVDAAAKGVVDSNIQRVRGYLRWVLIGSLPFTALVVIATGSAALLFAARRLKPYEVTLPILLLALAGSIAGFIWFIVSYATAASDTDVVKASYMIQLLPLFAVLVAWGVERLWVNSRPVGAIVIGVLAATVVLNSGTFLTRCIVH